MNKLRYGNTKMFIKHDYDICMFRCTFCMFYKMLFIYYCWWIIALFVKYFN